jgi:hypothetical protein
MAASTSYWAIASVACAIANWFLIPVIGAILGVIFGHIALNEISSSQGQVEGRSMALAGLIIGYASLALGLCAFVGFLIALSLGYLVPQR